MKMLPVFYSCTFVVDFSTHSTAEVAYRVELEVFWDTPISTDVFD
jgi:hypothetical protein